MHPALKHGGYCVTGILPGEDRGAFDKLYQDLIAEFHPDGPLEDDCVMDIARYTWRKQNLETFRIAESARARYSAIVSANVPSQDPPTCFPRLGTPDPKWSPPDPADVKAGWEAARAQARKELGDNYTLVEMGDAASKSRMLEDFAIEERLGAMIERLLKRLWSLKAFKSLQQPSSSSADLPRLPGSKKAA
jgi:hypothetical protein